LQGEFESILLVTTQQLLEDVGTSESHVSGQFIFGTVDGMAQLECGEELFVGV
jgi:hypothetical protein